MNKKPSVSQGVLKSKKMPPIRRDVLKPETKEVLGRAQVPGISDAANSRRTFLSPNNQRVLQSPNIQRSLQSPRYSKIINSSTVSRNLQSPRHSRIINNSIVTGIKRQTSQSIKPISSEHESNIKSPGIRYNTLLDIKKMNKNSRFQISRVQPQKELALNPFHQEFHKAQWKNWMETVPEWILEMGIKGLRRQADKHNTEGNTSTENDENNINNSNRVKNVTEEMEVNNESTSSVEGFNEGVATEWREWSLQLTDGGKLLITGKTDESTRQHSRDITLCERVDANTLRHSSGAIDKLVGMPDHFTSLPYFVRNKFVCGFPDDWKMVMLMWTKYVDHGSPFDYNWTSSSIAEDASEENATYILASTPYKLNEDTHETAHTSGQTENTFSITKSEITPIHSTTQQNAKSSKHIVEEEHAEEVKEEDANPANSTFILEHPNTQQSDVKLKKGKLKRQHSKVTQRNVKRSRDVKEASSIAEIKHDASAVRLNNNTSTSSKESPTANKKIMNASKINASNAAADTTATASDSSSLARGGSVDKEISLHRWVPMLVNGSDLKITGYIKSENNVDVLHVTDIVDTRKSNTCFRSKTGRLYKLVGSFSDPQNTVPQVIQKKLMKGLPAQWKLMMKTWASMTP
ncbi:uncharacterized protein [Periplaneta americana]|uniref:uncharacterized protein isoform X2 n=1 Tax=Periplaneta americana TaxID=6978 RepID=UPI0037E8F0CE